MALANLHGCNSPCHVDECTSFGGLARRVSDVSHVTDRSFVGVKLITPLHANSQHFLDPVLLFLGSNTHFEYTVGNGDQQERGTVTTTPMPWNMTQSSCFSTLRTFDPILHKTKYRIAIHSIRDLESSMRDYNTTFTTYLTATAGRRFSQPIEFELVAMHYEQIFAAIDAGEIDFVFSNPGYVCAASIRVEKGL